MAAVRVAWLSEKRAREYEASRSDNLGPHRLAVRTPASHVGNTGSIPVGVANIPEVRREDREFQDESGRFAGTIQGELVDEHDPREVSIESGWRLSKSAPSEKPSLS